MTLLMTFICLCEKSGFKFGVGVGVRGCVGSGGVLGNLPKVSVGLRRGSSVKMTL